MSHVYENACNSPKLLGTDSLYSHAAALQVVVLNIINTKRLPESQWEQTQDSH